MTNMELLFVALMWAINIFVLLILPLLALCLIGQKRQRTAVLISLSLLCAEVLLTVLLCVQPPIIHLTDHALDAETKKIIRNVSDGRYNDVLPVFPTAVVVVENEDGFLRWRTYYGLWGRTEHIYADTYEMTEPLWRW